ncbi:hypothetical protein SCA50_0316 [Salmonella enterica subsp. enterica serovar Choleraesuis str. SCSA50]|uniref:Uncharacterized protein n=2 Tax=Salmonella enterica subsp. enterica serovar Choleraesuis TaxID=119912 RepID=Q57SV7_SALCH|nr:hypothetical protein SCH_0298 [Salmonella enterica subsp. enterica serovar Choleraesuis str. SC-B67]EFZ04891.1 hypothetical protein SCA50_0316 [Salmonella enterica subsp. enterica serovar Choleraesuis str. SCSA50]
MISKCEWLDYAGYLQCNLAPFFSTLQRFWYGLNFRLPKNSPVLFPGIIISVSRHHVLYWASSKDDWLTSRISRCLNSVIIMWV